MTNTSAFTAPPARETESEARELAACYARVFLGDADGKRVLADLRKHFGLNGEVFRQTPNGRLDYLSAAKVDGQRDVMRHVEHALHIGSPGQGLQQ